jgi:hypothetical protein
MQAGLQTYLGGVSLQSHIMQSQHRSLKQHFPWGTEGSCIVGTP